MSLLALLGNFDNGTSADGPEVATEFTQLLSALNATSTIINLSTKFSGSDPTYAFDQLGSGDIVQFRKSGSELASINNSGQFESAVVTGTAPIIVASTTKVTNLNADLLDGISSLGFLADPGGNGFVDRTAAGTTANRTLTGTANQVSITNGGGGGNPVFSTPQDIATSSSPTFGGLTVSSTAPTISLTDTTASAADFQLVVDVDSFFVKAVAVGDAIVVTSSTMASTFAGQVNANANLRVSAGGVVIKAIGTGTATIDPASLLSGGSTTATFTVTGAAAGDVIIMTPPAALETGLIGAQAVVTSADTVTLRVGNYSAGTVDGASRDWGWMWLDIT